MKRIGILSAAVTLVLPLVGGSAFLAVPAYALTCAPATATPTDGYPGVVVVADNFESGTLSGYVVKTGGTGTVTVSSAAAHDGACSAYIHATADSTSLANFSTVLPSGTQQVYADGWFDIAQAGASGNNVPYFRFFSGSTRFADVFRDNSSGAVYLRVLTPAGTYAYTELAASPVPLNAWHRLAVHVVPNGSSTTVQVWFDGASVYSSSQVDTAASSVTSVMNGAEHVSQAEDAYIDDLIVKSVTNAAVASFTAKPASGAAPLSVAFTDTSTGTPTSWSWNFGDGTGSTVQNPTHTYAKAGTYTATLTAANANGASSASSTITATAATASFTASPASGIAPLSVAFTDTSTGTPTSWSWNFGDGTGSTVQNPTHSYTAAGTYTATLSAGYGSTSQTATTTITVTTLAQAMDAKAAQWGLGTATSAVTAIRDGGYYRNYQYGAIISAPWHSLFVSHGAIRSEWAALAFENGIMGYPTTDEVGGLRNGGVYQNYQGGAVIWSPATGAHESLGIIRSEWQATGFEGGPLGYPTTEVVTGLLDGGLYQNYQGGAIVSSPAAGTHESTGAIRTEWQATGFERGVLGYPATEIVTGLVDGGSYQNYQGGAIVSSPAAGTHESYGPIRAAWQSTGFETGTLGYPTTEVYPVPGGTAQDFQGGKITDIDGTITITHS